MKRIVIAFSFLLMAALCKAQYDIDSILAAPQLIELSVSTPQPRLGETFRISMDVNHLRANIFKSLIGKVELEDHTSDDGLMTMSVEALQKGKQEVGPLSFIVDKTRYTTNKIVYEVIDPLPDVDSGLWFRKVKTSDSTFCIIIEQRIPASEKITKKSDNSMHITTEPQHENIVKFKDSYSVAGINAQNSYINTSFSSVYINGEDRRFMYGYSVYHFNIRGRDTKIKITVSVFENIPEGYKFEDIIIQ